MELPSELVSIVREYSKPLFRYSREYKQALTALGKDEWQALKEKLCSKDAEEVLQLIQDYVAAFLERHAADQELEEFEDYGGPSTPNLVGSWAERRRLMDNCNDAQLNVTWAYHCLKNSVDIWEKDLDEDGSD